MFPWKQTKKTRKIPSFLKYIRYFLSESSIHGFNQLAKPRRHIVEYIIWTTSIILCTYGAILLSKKTLSRYQENPTVISMERNRFAWNTSFPSVTICPSTKISDGALEEYLHNSNATDKTKLKAFILSLASATYTNFDTVISYDGIESKDYMNLLFKLKFEFKPTLSGSVVHAEHMVLQQTVLELGICYSFNSQLAYYNSETYWKENKKGFVKQHPTFDVNPLDGEVFTNIVNMSTGYSIFIHGPYETVDISSKNMHVDNGLFLQILLNGLSLYSSERIRGLTVTQRKCRFYDESNLQRSPVYSNVLCRMECRATLAQKLCGCVPHFYRKIDSDKTCDVQGLHCLAKYKERFISVKKECLCYQNCEESNYVIEDTDLKTWFLGSSLLWGLKEYPRMRLKRDVIFGFSDLLVYIGGMIGLFLGCSVLSLIEIVYFFTLRLFWYWKKRSD